MAPMVFAHQGGWDEALLVLSPLVVIGALLWLANHRASRHAGDPEPAATDPAELSDTSD
jgi:hypothetical protein